MNETANVLRKAADYMEEHGKCSGAYEDSRGRVCAVGAIARAMNQPHLFDGPYYVRQKLTGYLRSNYFIEPYEDAANWSDRDSDKRRVVRGLRAAADYMEGLTNGS